MFGISSIKTTKNWAGTFQCKYDFKMYIMLVSAFFLLLMGIRRFNISMIIVAVIIFVFTWIRNKFKNIGVGNAIPSCDTGAGVPSGTADAKKSV
jgi:hypothetical protein